MLRTAHACTVALQLCCSCGGRTSSARRRVQATNHLGLECVPLYDTLGENAIEYIIDHSESTFVVVGAAKLPAFVKALAQIKQKLKGVVYWGSDVQQSDLKALADKGITATQFDTFVADGVSKDTSAAPPRKGDVCTIMYTSGARLSSLARLLVPMQRV